MEKCNEPKQQGVMLSTRTPLEAPCGEGGLVPGRGQGTVSECSCLNVHKWKIKWGDVSKVEKSTSLDGDAFDFLPSY